MAEMRIENLRHSYVPNPRSEKDFALKTTNLVWEEGLAYALLGPSGSGKTTMLNILSGLLIPSEGRILIDGRDVTALEARDRNIAQVFQFPVVYETMTVRENLAFPLRTRRVDPSKIRTRTEFVAGELGLTALLDRKARSLTAEQKQRISLGRGLVRDDVAAILLDEPLTVIDPAEKMSLRRTLKAVQANLGVMLIYVTHDQHEAMTLADRVLVMDHGAVVQSGTPQELFEHPTHRFVGYFIGTPGMNFISAHLGDGGLHVGDGVLPVSAAARKAIAAARGKLTLGIRPDFLSIAAEADGASIPGRIVAIQDHGDEKVVSIDIGPETVMARIPSTRAVTVDDAIRLRAAPNFTRVFDGDRSINLPTASFDEAVS